MIFIFLFAAEKDVYFIMECFRDIASCTSLQRFALGDRRPVHCYLAFAKNDEILESRGFDDTGVKEEDKADFKQCRTLRAYPQKDAALVDWDKVLKRFEREAKYDLATMNCCTKCVDALRNAGFDMHLHCEEVNRYWIERLSKEAVT